MAIEINGTATITTGWCEYTVHGFDGDLPEGTIYQWSTSGVSNKYAAENGKSFKFYIEEGTYNRVPFNVYCNVTLPDRSAATAKLEVNAVNLPAEAPIDPVVVVDYSYPTNYLDLASSVPLKLNILKSIGLASTDKVTWVVESPFAELRYSGKSITAEQSITVADLVSDKFSPQGCVEISVTATVTDSKGCVRGVAGIKIPLADSGANIDFSYTTLVDYNKYSYAHGVRLRDNRFYTQGNPLKVGTTCSSVVNNAVVVITEVQASGSQPFSRTSGTDAEILEGFGFPQWFKIEEPKE